MQIVVLVGGRGTRLGSLTNDIPKPMMMINGIPFLEILIKYLKQQGFTKIILCIGYLSNKIENYFLDGRKFGVEIKYSKEETPLGTGGAVSNAISLLEDEFIIINGDTFLELDYKKFIDFSHKQKKLCVVVGFSSNQDSDFINNLFINKESEVKTYSKNKSFSNLNYVDAGIYFFKKEFMKFLNGPYPISLENDIFPKLIQKKEMSGYVTDKKFYDIGTPEKINKFKKFFENF